MPAKAAVHLRRFTGDKILDKFPSKKWLKFPIVATDSRLFPAPRSLP